MKKITLLIFAAFMCSMAFGQFAPRQCFKLETPFYGSETKDYWRGSMFAASFFQVNENDEFAVVFNVRGDVDAVNEGDTITKIMVRPLTRPNYPNYNGNTFALKIYENMDMTEPHNPDAAVYSQDFTATTDGEVTIIELTTPYIVPDHQFVLTLLCKARTLISLGHQYDNHATYEGPVTYYLNNNNQWGESYFSLPSSPNSAFYAPIFLAAYVVDGTEEIPPAFLDLAIEIFDKEEDFPTATTFHIRDVDPLEFIPAIFNYGPSRGITGNIRVTVELNGVYLTSWGSTLTSLEGGLSIGRYMYWPDLRPFSITTAQLDEYGIEIGEDVNDPKGNFTVTVSFTCEDANGVDPIPANNSKTIACKRLTSIVENVLENTTDAFKVSPNPATNNFTLTLINAGVAQVELFNLVGQKVYGTTTAEQTLNVDVSNFSNGIYMLRVSQNEKIHTSKVIVR